MVTRKLNRGWPICVLTLSVVALLVAVTGNDGFQMDFNGDLYAAGTRIVHGVTPYEPRVVAAQAAAIRAGRTIHLHASPRYPAPALVAAVPLSFLPRWLADLMFSALCLAAVVVALRLLGVRDWRCYALAGISCPVSQGILVGNLSPLLLLGCAAAWRWRSRVWPLAGTVAAVVMAKLILWPLGAWLLITRRFRAAAIAFAIMALGTAAAWGVVGYSTLIHYPQFLLDVTTIGEGRGCSLVGFLMWLGLPYEPARVIALACGLGLLALAHSLVRRHEDHTRGYGLVVLAAITACPVVWAHYLALLYVPIALLSPGVSTLWFLPMIAALTPTPAAHSNGWASLPVLAAELAVIYQLCLPLLPERVAALRTRPAQIGRRPSVATASAAAPS